MATITPGLSPETKADFRDQEGVAMRDVGWKGYLTLLKLRGERKFPRMVYLDGTVWLMSPSFRHEVLAERLGFLVNEILVNLGIPYKRSGSTTFRRQAEKGGFEPDKSYYLANAHKIRGNTDIHLSKDPPPDLVIEAVSTHAADAAVEAYRRFEVPEVWICDGSELTVLLLQPDREYAHSKTSAAFPFLKAVEILEWVARPETNFDTEWDADLRTWVRETLLPRTRRTPPGGG